MAGDIIPSIYSQRSVGQLPFYAGNLYSNIKLHQGEVKEVISPNDSRSLSKLFYEYKVLVGQLEGGMFAHKIYHCFLINPLAGGGDQSSWELRASTKDLEDPNNIGKTDGSRVLILCVEGSNNQAFILGGLRDERCSKDDPKLGHHFNWEFNGVNFKVKNDGSWEIINKGKTDNLGKKHPDANDDGVGTIIKTESNGNILIKTKGSEINIDNNNEKITINASSEVSINSNNVNVGSNANQQLVLGNELVQILTELIQTLITTTVSVGGTGNGDGIISSPPINKALFMSMIPRLQLILSRHNKTS